MTTLRDIEHKLGRLGAESNTPTKINVYVASFTERDSYCKLTFFHDIEKSLVRLRYHVDYDGSGAQRRYDVVYSLAYVEETPHIKGIYDTVKTLTIDNSNRVLDDDDVPNVNVKYYHCNFRSAHYEYSANTLSVPIRQPDCEDPPGYDGGIDWHKLDIFSGWVGENLPGTANAPIVQIRERRRR